MYVYIYMYVYTYIYVCVYVDGSSFRTSRLTAKSHRELLSLALLGCSPIQDTG